MNWIITIWFSLLSFFGAAPTVEVPGTVPSSTPAIVISVKPSPAPSAVESPAESLPEAIPGVFQTEVEVATPDSASTTPPTVIVVPIIIPAPAPVPSSPQPEQIAPVQAIPEVVQQEVKPMPNFTKEPEWKMPEEANESSKWQVSWTSDIAATSKFFLLDRRGETGTLQKEFESGTDFQFEVDQYNRPIFYRIELINGGEISVVERQVPQR